MNRIRFGALLTAILGVIYGAAGLMESVTSFGIGMAVAAAAITLYGLLDFIETSRDERIRRQRLDVWFRRDLEEWRSYRDEAA
jgi:hypothetical protein